MLTIIHGDDEVAIHRSLVVLLSQSKEQGIAVERLESKGLQAAVLESILGTQELFASRKLVVIDRLHSLPKSSLKDDLIAMVSSAAGSGTDVLLVENRLLTPTQLKKFPSATVILHKLPAILFHYIESIRPGAGASLITLFHKVIQTQEVEFVFAMMVKQIRTLLGFVADGVYEGPPFARGKIAAQAQWFKKDQLLELHERLLQIDIGQKTSRSPLTLVQEIDLWLAQVYNEAH